MKIYQIGQNVVVQGDSKVKNITKLRPSIKTSIDLIKVALGNDLSVSEYLKKTMDSKEGNSPNPSIMLNPRIPIDHNG